jgi:hypothetical protein
VETDLSWAIERREAATSWSRDYADEAVEGHEKQARPPQVYIPALFLQRRKISTRNQQVILNWRL